MHTTPETEPNPASLSAPAAKPLNQRQEKFCDHYSVSGNAAEAARLAGYSPDWADNQGYRLARDPRVRDRVYEMRVNRAIQFGPVVAFTRLENLYRKASAGGDWRAAAMILTLQARLAGVEAWKSPAAAQEGYRDQPRRRRGVYGLKGPDPFDDLSENGGLENDEEMTGK